MALDIHNLSATELIRLVNSTTLGTVLNAPKLNRQRNVAGYRIGDGKRINLVRYVAWRIREREKPQAEPLSYEERKRRQAQRNADLVKAGQDIAPIPDVEDMARRLHACDNFRFFCETYFPQAFFRGWSDDHLRVIEKIERAVTEGGLFAFAMPRGSGKTSLARISGLWAVLSGRRPYVCLIGGSKERATDLLAPIRTEILHNGLLQADFPDAIYPLRKLENNARRQGSQHIAGKLTLVRWSADKLVFPSMVGDNLPMALRKAGHDTAPAGGSIIAACRYDEIAESFCAMYDDTYFVNPIILPDITVPRAAKRWTKQALTRWHPKRKHDRRRKRSMQLFSDRAGHAWDFSTHMPYWYNKKRFTNIARRYRLQHKDFLRETVYFNALLPKGETPALLQPKDGPHIQYRTCKHPPYDVLARETANVLFLNHCDKSWTADMQRLLTERLGESPAATWASTSTDRKFTDRKFDSA